MDGDKNLKALLDFLYAIMPGVIILAAGFIMFWFYDAETLRVALRLLLPLVLYLSGVGGAFVIRKRRSEIRKSDAGGTDQTTITVSYMALFWHDALVFGTPCLIILAAYCLKGQVELFDIVASAIACCGLYLSELIYRKK